MKRRELIQGLSIAGISGIVVLFAWQASERREDAPRRDDDQVPTTTEEPTTTREQTVRHAEEYETVVDAIEAGADPSGQQPINGFLEEHANDDTLLSFRGGRYKLERASFSNLSNFAIATAYGERPTFVSTNGECPDMGRPYLEFAEISNMLLDGVDFDFRGEGSGGEIRITASDTMTIRDVQAIGNCSDQIAMTRFEMLDEGGTGVVENLRTHNHKDNSSLVGIYVGEPHAGELTFRNCQVRGFSGNGLYASAPGLEEGSGGSIHVEGGHYDNNNISNVRLGGPASSVTDTGITVDKVPPQHVGVNVRGIRLNTGYDHRIDNCTIHFEKGAGSGFGGVVFHGETGGGHVSNSTITIDRDNVRAITAFPPDGDNGSGIVFDSVTIDGSASGGHTALIEGRDGTVFRNCTITGSGSDRGGIYFRYANNCTIVDSRIDVTGNPLVIRQSTVDIRNSTIVTKDGENHIENMNAADEDFTPRGTK